MHAEIRCGARPLRLKFPGSLAWAVYPKLLVIWPAPLYDGAMAASVQSDSSLEPKLDLISSGTQQSEGNGDQRK